MGIADTSAGEPARCWRWKGVGLGKRRRLRDQAGAAQAAAALARPGSIGRGCIACRGLFRLCQVHLQWIGTDAVAGAPAGPAPTSAVVGQLPSTIIAVLPLAGEKQDAAGTSSAEDSSRAARGGAESQARRCELLQRWPVHPVDRWVVAVLGGRSHQRGVVLPVPRFAASWAARSARSWALPTCCRAACNARVTTCWWMPRWCRWRTAARCGSTTISGPTRSCSSCRTRSSPRSAAR